MSLATWNPAMDPRDCRAERANGPRRTYWPSVVCALTGRRVDPGSTNIGCAECRADYRAPGCGPWCAGCYERVRHPDHDPHETDNNDHQGGDDAAPF